MASEEGRETTWAQSSLLTRVLHASFLTFVCATVVQIASALSEHITLPVTRFDCARINHEMVPAQGCTCTV